MRKSSIIGLSMLTAGLLASSAASAGIVTVDGVSIPEGFVPGGFYIDAELSFENVVTKVGQTFNGIFKVDAIHDASANGTYAYGQNGSYLTGIFENFVATSVVAPTSSTGGTITFTGGDIKYYVESSNTFTNNAGQATDIANASSGKLWLAADPAAIDSSGSHADHHHPGEQLPHRLQQRRRQLRCWTCVRVRRAAMPVPISTPIPSRTLRVPRRMPTSCSRAVPTAVRRATSRSPAPTSSRRMCWAFRSRFRSRSSARVLPVSPPSVRVAARTSKPDIRSNG